MLDQAALEGLQAAFWPLYVIAVTAGVVAFALRRQWCMARTLGVLVFVSLGQTVWEGMQGSHLLWWQHMALDVPAFWLITLPPRRYWQAVIGGLVAAQIAIHAIWGMAPDLAREHWLAVTLIGFVKCFVLLLWSGGVRVENHLGRAARLASRLVPATLKGSVA